jgi:hypothetical protein
LYRATAIGAFIGIFVGMSAAEAACPTLRLNAATNKLAIFERIATPPHVTELLSELYPVPNVTKGGKHPVSRQNRD